MQKVIITSPATFAAGTRLALTESQSAVRQHVLVAQGEGIYQTTGPVQFKIGEEIGIEGEIPKSLATLIETEASAKAKARGKK